MSNRSDAVFLVAGTAGVITQRHYVYNRLDEAVKEAGLVPGRHLTFMVPSTIRAELASTPESLVDDDLLLHMAVFDWCGAHGARVEWVEQASGVDHERVTHIVAMWDGTDTIIKEALEAGRKLAAQGRNLWIKEYKTDPVPVYI